ncbi:hypothetical protein GBAR_LOCUS16014 [Geodia barretti]|uniref:Retroviral aspartyl protease n=1 Tax=Geodia barretti TaxID=519541 RepID=A0AA35SEB6_GEOBA|nr:hypothetical protein GBAR_LOCUS16014 [Geodia barretti]
MMKPQKHEKSGKGEKVGVFEVPLGIGSPGEGEPTLVSALVDTGAIHSMIPASLLSQLQVAPLEKFSYALADGGEVKYDFGMARLGIADYPERYCPVIFGPEDQYLIGATTLEFFNLMVDPVEGKLIRRMHQARPV